MKLIEGIRIIYKNYKFMFREYRLMIKIIVMKNETREA